MALQSISEHFNPPGLRNYNRSDYLQALSDDAIATMVEHFATVPTPQTHIVIEHLGRRAPHRPRRHRRRLPRRAL